MSRGGKNAYAAKLMAAKAAMSQDEKRALIRRILTTIRQAEAVALNDEFGFGAKRFERFCRRMEAVFDQYGDFLDDIDADFADGKLEAAYKRIVDKKKS